MTRPSLTHDRSGKVKIATVIFLVVAVFLLFCGFQYGTVYFRKFRLVDAVNEELSYAGQRADEAIRQRIAEKIQDLHVPSAGRSFQLARVGNPRGLQLSISYVETVNLLFTKKRVRVSVRTRRPF